MDARIGPGMVVAGLVALVFLNIAVGGVLMVVGGVVWFIEDSE